MKKLLYFLFITVSTTVAGQTLTEEEKYLENWLPASFGEYKLEGVPLTSTSRSGDKPYSMSSKTYRKGQSTLTVVIFDYDQNRELLTKYAASWSSPVSDTDPQKGNITTVEEFPAWQSYDEAKRFAQLYVNVKGRYLLYVSGAAGTTVDFLKKVVAELRPRQLPQ